MSPINLKWTGIAVVAFCMGMSCGVLSTWLFYLMRADINRKLPPDGQIRRFGGTPLLYSHVQRLHREMYPQSKRRFLLNMVITIGLLSAIVAAWALDVI
jgi:hypothetical protein